MKDIGILNLTRFGDLVQTSPVLAGLRRRFPDARLHLIVKSRFRPVAELLPHVDVLHEIDGDAIARFLTDPGIGFLDAYAKIADVVDAFASLHFDVLVNFTHSRSSAALLSLLSADAVVGFAMNRDGQRTVENPWLRHMSTLVRSRRVSHVNLVDVYLGSVGLTGCGERLQLRVPPAARGFAESRLAGPGPRVGVQLGASADNKTWSVERYARSLEALAPRLDGLQVVLVGIPAERERARALIERCPGIAFVDLVGGTRIDELAAVVQRLDLLLTNDTGTMHLAGAVGTTTCALFVGPGYPWETAVYAEGHWTLSSRVECAPCGHFVQCGHPICHEDVPPAWLAELVERILEGRGAEGLPALPRADLHRTRFDEDGLLDLMPAHPRPPSPQDLLALAYRPAFLESLTQRPARPEPVWQRALERFGIAPDGWPRELPAELPAQLEELARLARRAAAVARELERGAPSASELREAGARLQALDERIYTVARIQPLLGPFGYALEEDLLTLPGLELQELAGSSRSRYEQLARRVDVVRHIIRGAGSPGSLEGGATR